MSDLSVASSPSETLGALGIGFHHVGIQTADMDNCVSWYREFFGAEVNWSLEEFSDLTRSRLPGIVRLVEIAVAGLRFHVFQREGSGEAISRANVPQFQHICVSAGSREAVEVWRRRYVDLFDSGDYAFEVSEPATFVDVDSGGVASFYCYDVNGLEFEFTHVPGGAA
jgi:catechol 2,3-dioxygenase-like lactoylglutathione lyase family enzyme